MIDQIVYISYPEGHLRKDEIENVIIELHRIGTEYGIPVNNFPYRLREESISPLYVSLGGDGTMLTALRCSAQHPDGTVLGVNFGKLGFLTSIYNCPEAVIILMIKRILDGTTD